MKGCFGFCVLLRAGLLENSKKDSSVGRRRKRPVQINWALVASLVFFFGMIFSIVKWHVLNCFI